MMCLQCGAKFPDESVNEHVCVVDDLPTTPLRDRDFRTPDGRIFRLTDFDADGRPIYTRVII